MAFERIEKLSIAKQRLQDNQIAINSSGFCISMNLFNNIEFLEVYLDKEGRRIGFKEGNHITGFKVRKTTGSDSSNMIHLNRETMKRISKGRHFANEEDGMFIIKEVEIV